MAKRPAKPKEHSASPLDEKRKALAEHERKINDAIERRTRLIEAAPKLKQEQAKQRREELLKRNSRVETGAGARTSLPDKRFDATTTSRPRPRLKREQRQGMLTFFVLLVAVACVLVWIYFTLFRST